MINLFEIRPIPMNTRLQSNHNEHWREPLGFEEPEPTVLPVNLNRGIEFNLGYALPDAILLLQKFPNASVTIVPGEKIVSVCWSQRYELRDHAYVSEDNTENNLAGHHLESVFTNYLLDIPAKLLKDPNLEGEVDLHTTLKRKKIKQIIGKTLGQIPENWIL